MAAVGGEVGRQVVDRTGLTGKWDFFVTYTPMSAAGSPADTDAPGLFTALQEQLGLRLESTEGPVNVFVVDRLERPTE